MKLWSILSALASIATVVSASDELYSTQPSKFNGQEVPPLQALSGDNITQALGHGNW
jgi:hypothetical protein